MKNILSKNSVENYNPEKITRYSIRKASFGATSVAVAAFFMYLGQGTAAAADNNIQNQENKISSTDENKNTDIENTVEKTSNETVVKSTVVALDKTKLSSLINEIESKIASGAYDSKTEDSVAKLRVELGTVKAILENAKTQEELTRAYNKLITATTQLKTKPEDKKEAPVVDTTNGKDTVGIKATNTEKAKESNSIVNSGSRDERNGKSLNTNNPFRTDSTTTDTDASANQTYTAPAANANLATLSNELKNLPNFIENNKKVQDMDTLGNALNVEKGSVTEINEFGGWKAVGDTGKFAIARKTEAGVFPIETVNTVWAESTKSYVTWVLEQSFNRDSDYMLFLSKVRTKASSTEEAYDNSTYVSTGLGNKIAKGVKGFDGIQKTFKAYSKEHGSKVIVSFKTGYTGDIDGTKAQYKVEVIINRNGQEEKLYNQTFTPEVSKTNTEMTVVKASDGKNSPQNFSTPGTPVPTKAELEAKMANNKPNGTGGTFKSKEIDLPEGVTEYTVRISSADNQRLGMGYQSPYRHYALPVTGLDFNIDQDTGAIAKDLLSRIYDKLKATETADTDGKTNETKAAYLTELENIKTLVTSTDVKKTAEYKEALESILSKQLALRVDKTGLTDSKALLDGLVNEDPTPGKTQDTATAYNATKQEAIKAIEAAKTVIENENATVAQVREALATVNAKKTALQQAKDGLIEAATAEEKAKLKADADSLVKADTTGKTPNSIEAYNRKYEELKAQLEAAKTEAAAVLAKENNASKTEAQAAQTKVDAAKAELTKAAELLVNKADKTELTNAKAALNTLATETDPTTGKTADSAKAYNDAKTAAQEAIQEAETVINDENATPERVSAALEKVNAKKAALQQAKDGLIEAATAEEKAKLKADAASLVKAETTGKTPNSIEAYNRKYEELKAQLEAAKTEAAAVLAKENNASKTEAQAAQTKVDDVKTELENAKNLLVEAATAEEKTKLKTDSEALKKAETTGKTADSIKAYETEYEKLKAQLEEAKAAAAAVEAKGDNATKAEAQEAQAKVDAAKKALEKAAELLKDKEDKTELTKAKEALSTLVSEADPTTGKTADSAKSYNDAKTAAEEAIKAAETVINDENATHDQVTEALNKVNEKKAALEAAKQALVEAATAEEKAKLKADADSLVKADTTGKTPNSIAAYNTKYEALKAQLDAAKTEAAKVLAKENNASKAEAQAAQAKVDAAKAELTKAAELLVNKADKTELTKAKEALSTLASEADPTTGKTVDSAKAYNDAKTAAIEAIEAAEMVINDENATQEQVTEALNKVNEKKAALEAAKQALVEAATVEEKAKLKADSALLMKADETGKTPDSIAAYEAEYEKLKAQLEEAKVEAEKVLAKENNATKEEVKAAQAKVDVVKKALEKAAELLKDLVDKTKLTTEATTDAEETKGSPAYYNADEAKKAAYDKALSEAKKVLENDKATQAEVNAALKALEEAKAALNGQPTNKDALTKAATTDAEETKGSPAYYNAD
uniref:YSIRK-type signal peptide-containing protein n=1 Tax=uncultured Gemella sp. TaxID=254352 RepID=UPI0028EC2B5B